VNYILYLLTLFFLIHHYSYISFNSNTNILEKNTV